MRPRPRNAMIDIDGFREIGCPETSVHYTAMKVAADGTPIAKFAGRGCVRSIEIEVDDEILANLDTRGDYAAHAIIREAQGRLDLGEGAERLPGLGGE